MANQTRTKQSSSPRKGAPLPATTRTRALAKRTTGMMAGDRHGIVDENTRHAMIAEAAYFRAERRGFSEGGALNDWLEAEREITRILGG